MKARDTVNKQHLVFILENWNQAKCSNAQWGMEVLNPMEKKILGNIPAYLSVPVGVSTFMCNHKEIYAKMKMFWKETFAPGVLIT